MEYTLHSTEFVHERRKSACALLKGEKKGEKVLAIAGGFNAPGLEVWNPADDSVTMMLLHARGDFVVLPVRGVTCP